IVHQSGPGRIFARFTDRTADQAHRGDDHAVADFQVPQDARGAAAQAVAADLRAAGDRGAAGHRGVRADADVVADLDLVVEAHVFLEHGVLDRATVDGGVGADLAVVAD